MDFARLVKSERIKHFPSARNFHRNSEISCSHVYYSKIEAGTLPDVNLAIEILKALKINVRKGLYSWVRSQMPDSETRAMFTELNDSQPRSSNQMSIESSLVVNRMQGKLLESDPVYWEILVYLFTYFGHHNADDGELAKVFKIHKRQMRKYTEKLHEYGLIDRDKDEKIRTKEWIFIPYSDEFKKLRDLNFGRAHQKFEMQPDTSKFRTTLTRLLTPAQQKEIEARVRAIANAIVDLPEKHDDPESAPYTVGVFASPRGFGNA